MFRDLRGACRHRLQKRLHQRGHPGPRRTVIAAAERAGAPAALFAHEAKESEAGLIDAAKALGPPLVFLGGQVLRQASLLAATNSPRVMRMFGLLSIAEVAALAPAGPSFVQLRRARERWGASRAIAGKRVL